MRNLINKAKLALAFFVIISFLFLNLTQVTSPVWAEAEKPSYEQSTNIESKALDPRASILQQYLAMRNSPMQYSAQDFIDAADKHEVDWKLVPAIAGVESTFGKHVPGGTNPSTSSFNAYGWGVYGTNAIYFDSWKDGIYTLNQGLKEKYINRGLKTPAQMNRVYAASTTWGSRVSFFMEDIEQFAKKYEQKNPSKDSENSRLGNVLNLRVVQPKPSSAPLPAIIAFK